jgi:uncharacterized OB-fold protein
MAADDDMAMLPMLRCRHCGRVDTPTRSVCSGCLSDQLEPISVPGIGTLASWTTIRRAPTRFRDQAPYDVVVVDLDSGQRVTGRLAHDAPEPVFKQRVSAVKVEGGDTIFRGNLV